MRKKRDLVEVFGYAPEDLSREARSLWNIGGCPFVNKACSFISGPNLPAGEDLDVAVKRILGVQ